VESIVKIRAWDGDSDSLRQAAEVYAAVFSERPYQGEPDEEVESFIERARRYQDQLPDFRLLVATADSDVVGLALGSGTMAGDWWYDAVSQQLSHEQRERWMPGQCFSVGELLFEKISADEASASASCAASSHNWTTERRS